MTGRYLLDVLLEDSFYDHVVALVRRPIGRGDAKIEERVVDFDSLSAPDVQGVTHMFCCLGTTIKKAGSKEAFRHVDHDYALRFAQWGIGAGAQRMMLVSSVGADEDSGNFYLRVKGELERDLERLPFEGLHIFRPSFLLGRREEQRTGEALGIRLARGFEWMMVGDWRRYRPMPAGVLAASMAAAGERGEPGRHVYHYDQIYRMAGF